MLILSVFQWKICGFAICGLAHQQNLRICNLGIKQKKICGLTYLRNLQICDCGLSPRICGFKKNSCAATFANLPPVSTIPVVNCHQYQRHRRSICHQRQRWCTLICEYFSEFSNKFKTALMGYSGAWGKLIHEKKPEVKNLLPLSL